MVKVRGRNSNRKTVKQTVKNGPKISGGDAAQPAWVTGARRQQFAAASRFWTIPNLMPRSTVTRVWLTEYEWAHLGQLCGTLTIFFFFFFVVSWVLFDKTVTEYRVWHKVHGTAEEVRCYPQIPGWQISANEATQTRCIAVRCSSATSKTGNRFGWSFFFAVWRRCARSQLHMNSVVLVESQGSYALVRIVQLQKFDRRDNIIFTVHLNRLIDENTPLEQSTIETCPQEVLWHRVKVRSIVTGLRHDDERDDDRSHRRISIMSSLDAGWFRLITNILIQSRDLAMIARWHQCGTMTSQMLARASFSALCLTVFPFEFQPRTFTIRFYGKSSIISELMILECSFPLKRTGMRCASVCLSVANISILHNVQCNRYQK